MHTLEIRCPPSPPLPLPPVGDWVDFFSFSSLPPPHTPTHPAHVQFLPSFNLPSIRHWYSLFPSSSPSSLPHTHKWCGMVFLSLPPPLIGLPPTSTVPQLVLPHSPRSVSFPSFHTSIIIIIIITFTAHLRKTIISTSDHSHLIRPPSTIISLTRHAIIHPHPSFPSLSHVLPLVPYSLPPLPTHTHLFPLSPHASPRLWSGSGSGFVSPVEGKVDRHHASLPV